VANSAQDDCPDDRCVDRRLTDQPVARQVAPKLSRQIGIRLTSAFYNIEGEFILVFQAIQTPETSAYFSSIYVYGYTFLLIFPVIACFTLSDTGSSAAC